jgi:hypothetical protein
MLCVLLLKISTLFIIFVSFYDVCRREKHKQREEWDKTHELVEYISNTHYDSVDG